MVRGVGSGSWKMKRRVSWVGPPPIVDGWMDGLLGDGVQWCGEDLGWLLGVVGWVVV